MIYLKWYDAVPYRNVFVQAMLALAQEERYANVTILLLI